MDLPHQILGVDLGIFVVPADELFRVVRETPRTENRVFRQADGPEVGISLIGCAIGEGATQILVEDIVDAVAILMEDHIAHQREGRATVSFRKEIDGG